MSASFLDPIRRAFPFLLVSLLIACGPTGGDDPDQKRRDGGLEEDAGDGGDDKDGGNGDGGDDTEDVEVCTSWPEVSAPFELDRFGPAQYAVSVASDGEVLWVGYTRASQAGQGGMQAFGLPIGCDGTPGEPLLLSTAQGDPARSSPSAAVGAKRVMVGWTENDTEESRLLVRYRVLKRDGTPLATTDSTFEPVVGGEKRKGSLSWLGIGASSDGFVLGAQMNVEGVVPSRAVIQRLDADGAPVGETVLADPSDERAQNDPAVAVEPSGRVHLAWETEGAILRSSLEPEEDVFLPSPAEPALYDRQGNWPTASASRTGGWAWFAFSSQTMVAVSNAKAYDVSPRLILGDTQQLDTLPVVAASPTGGAVAWLRRTGTRYAVLAQPFVANGGTMLEGTPVQVSVGADAPVARPSIVHLSGNTYFVAWIEGSGQDSHALGRFVTLE